MPDDEVCREAVGVFHDERILEAAVDELLIAGFDRSQMSLLAGERAVQEKLGHLYGGVQEIEDDPDVPTRAFVDSDSRTEGKAALAGGLAYVGAVAASGAIVLSGGTILIGIIGAALAGGAGGALGTLLARYFERRHARYLHEQLEHGGILLWVRTPDAQREAAAVEILKRHAGEDVHVHDLPTVRYELSEGGVSKELSFMSALGM
jgi:hypothetical protein